MARTITTLALLVSIIVTVVCTNANGITLDGLTSGAGCGDSLAELQGAGRSLLDDAGNGSTFTDPVTGFIYSLHGAPEYANSWEALINCSRMGLEQPDVTKPGDLFAIRYLSANKYVWVKSRFGDGCTYVQGPIIQVFGCSDKQLYMCVLRKPLDKCGKDSQGKNKFCAPTLKCCGGSTCCCASSTCCGGALCCHSGTKCCPGKLGEKPGCKHPLAKC